MKREEYEQHDAVGLAALVRRRDVSAAEGLDAALAAVDAANPTLNAVVTRFDDQARAAIAAGLPNGPFTGGPCLLKDVGRLYEGVVSSGGSALFRDFVPIGFASPFDSSGNPSMSVPLAWSATGLPLGVQVVRRFGDEATLFRLAGQLELEQAWAARRSPR
jgi:Asp-tRNA(Asn)/Glu-tRNA(Gln) amidotransferase A subunit family amidase